MKFVEFEWKGRRIRGAVSRGAGADRSSMWFSVDGEVWKVEDERARGRRSGSAKSHAADPSLITAPMPGKIIKVMQAPGAMVAAGDIVVVMEAMKMEYTLKAQAAGLIEEVTCSVGEQVVLGAALVRLKL